MLNFAPVEATIVRCLGTPSALDNILSLPEAFPCRVAPNELLFLAAPSLQRALVTHVTDCLATADPYALTIRQPDAWSIWVLNGEDHRRAFARLSPIQLPKGTAFFQGGVAHVPAKVLACADAIYIMVASTLGHHLRARLVAACADLNPEEGPATPFLSRHARVDAVR